MHQGDICVHCIPKRAFAFITYLQGYICTITSLQGAFASWHAPMGHLHHNILPSGHSHHDMHHGDICIMSYPQREHLHHDIPIRGHSHHDRKHSHYDILARGHLHHKILCISISTRRHLYRDLNTCTSIIMNKPCVSILAWDICIMEITFASLSGSICVRNKKI